MTPAVVILAAGRGSRLAGDLPKWFIRVNGRTLAERQLDALRAAGVERPLVVTGFRPELFDADALGAELVHNADWATRNNWFSLAVALEHLARENRDDAVCILNSDLLVGSRVVQRFLDAATVDPRSLLAVDHEAPRTDEQMKVAVEHGQVVDIGKGELVAPAAGEYVGLAKLAAEDAFLLRAILDEFAADPARTDEWYEGAFREAMRSGVEFGAVPVDPGRWIEIDDAADLERAEAVAALLEDED